MKYSKKFKATLSQRSVEYSHQFSSAVAQSCPTLCDPMNRSTPGFSVHHQLLESTKTYVHCVGDAIQPSHPLSSPSPPALNLSQHWSFQMSQLSTSDVQSIGVPASTSVPPMNTQDWSPLEWTSWISLQSKRLSQESSPTPQFKASILLHSAFFTTMEHCKRMHTANIV